MFVFIGFQNPFSLEKQHFRNLNKHELNNSRLSRCAQKTLQGFGASTVFKIWERKVALWRFHKSLHEFPSATLCTYTLWTGVEQSTWLPHHVILSTSVFVIPQAFTEVERRSWPQRFNVVQTMTPKWAATIKNRNVSAKVKARTDWCSTSVTVTSELFSMHPPPPPPPCRRVKHIPPTFQSDKEMN